VLGAGVKPDGKLSDMLADRVKTGVELYKHGKVDKLLMTGDHGRVSYDEVNAMRKFAEARGVPTEDIFMDHAGFCTYDSMYRAKAIFQVDSAIVITQKFHLPRSIFLARSMGIEASGVTADKQKYKGAIKHRIRETLACVQDFVRAKITHPKPKYLGDVIPITGDGRATHG
jgi:SanA protein